MLLKTRARRTEGRQWTAAKLTGAIFLAPIGCAVALVYMFGADYQNKSAMVFLVGVVLIAIRIGWGFLGKKAGFGFTKSIIRGFAAGVYVIVGAITWQSMIFTYNALNAASFDSPVIIPGILMQSFLKFAVDFATLPVLLTGMIGGSIVGRVVGAINWHWR